MTDHPDCYVLDCETYPRVSDLGRFLTDQIAWLSGKTLTSEVSGVLVAILEDRGLVELDGRKIRLPILALDGWGPLITEAEAEVAEGDGSERSWPGRAPRVRATPPAGEGSDNKSRPSGTGAALRQPGRGLSCWIRREL